MTARLIAVGEAVNRCLMRQCRAWRMPFGAFRVLAAMLDRPCRQRELAKSLGMRKPDVSRYVKVLVELEYLERRFSVDDQRAQWLVITSAGEQVRRDVHQALSATLQELDELIDTAARHRFNRLLVNAGTLSRARPNV